MKYENSRIANIFRKSLKREKPDLKVHKKGKITRFFF